jgi:hypothetical protein
MRAMNPIAAFPMALAGRGGRPGLDVLLLLLAALFWAVTHLWALLIVWAEARVTRSFGSDAGTKKEKP